MWWKEYKNTPPDTPLKKERIEPGKGIVGCEMHEINGWGLQVHRPEKSRPGLFQQLFEGIKRLFE